MGDGGVERARVLSVDEDVEAHALRRRGWTVAAIARHLGRDPRTVKAYLEGGRVAGVPDPMAPTATRDCPHCGQPITIVALLTTPEAARPHITQPGAEIVALRRA